MKATIAKKKSALTSYHFDIGNSSTGPLGCCARVTATSRTAALKMLRAALPDEVNVTRGTYRAVPADEPSAS
jgi:hypothetical protein